MNIKQANKLHNGDEVKSIETGEAIKVVSTEKTKVQNKQVVIISGIGPQSGCNTWWHDEVK